MKSLITTIAFSFSFVSTLMAGCFPSLEPCQPCPPPECESECRVPDPCCVKYEPFAALLFLQPNASNIYYGAEAITLSTNPDLAFPAASPSWVSLEIRPGYHPAIVLGTNFIFPATSSNVIFDVEFFSSKDSAKFTAPLESDMVGPFFDIGPNSILYKIAKGNVNFLFIGADLVAGKRVSVGSFLADLYSGVTYANIKEATQSTFSSTDGTRTRTIKATSTFGGIGPEFGLNFAFRFCRCFDFTGNFIAALIMGRLQNGTTYLSTTPELALIGNPSPNVQTTTVPKRWQLVPGFTEQMGFSWSGKCQCCNYAVGIGYQARIFLNAIQSVDMTNQVLPDIAMVTPEVGVFAVGFTRTLSNFMLSGPYLSIAASF